MNLPNTGSSHPVMNEHAQKPSMKGHLNSTAALDIDMEDSGIPTTSRMTLDNPFYAISTELHYLSSGVSLSLQPESSGQGDEGLNGSGLSSRREGRGREWMEAVRRIKGFVEGSDDRIYQISPADSSVSARLSSSRRPAKQMKRTRPGEDESFNPEINGQVGKRGRTSSYPSIRTRVQIAAGGRHEVEIYSEAPKELLDMIYLPLTTKGAGPSSSSASGNGLTGKDGATQADLILDEMSVQRGGGGRVPIWGTRETLVQGLERITSSGVLSLTSASASASISISAGTIPGPERGALGALEAGLEPGLNHTHNPRLELELEDYWPARPLKRTSTTNDILTRPGEPEFTLRFRLEGCLRGLVVFGPRVPRNRFAGPGEGDVDLDGFDGGDGGGIRNGRNLGREERKEKERMMAVRFNVFGDTELSKGKNDLSAYKTMVDLGRYLAGLELDFGETLDRLRAYGDLMSRPCFLCGRLQASSSSPGTVGVGGLGGSVGSGGLPIGRARASSDDQAGWMSFHLDCFSV